MRKSTKAAMSGMFVLLAVPHLQNLKDFLLGEQAVTNARLEKTMTDGFARIEGKFERYETVQRERFIRSRDLTDAAIAASELRCEKRTDDVKERVQNLEQFAFKIKPASRGG